MVLKAVAASGCDVGQQPARLANFKTLVDLLECGWGFVVTRALQALVTLGSGTLLSVS